MADPSSTAERYKEAGGAATGLFAQRKGPWALGDPGRQTRRTGRDESRPLRSGLLGEGAGAAAGANTGRVTLGVRLTVAVLVALGFRALGAVV